MGVHHFLLMFVRWVLPAVNRVVPIKERLVATVSGTHNKLKTTEGKSKRQKSETKQMLRRRQSVYFF